MSTPTHCWTVTRQHQWINSGQPVVEVSAGSLDYTNPDALSKAFAGEFETFTDPTEAAETAIRICRAWRQAGERRATVGHGATGGSTMPFEPCSFKELREWAQERLAALPRCPQCGGLMGSERWKPTVFYVEDDEACCSASCCDKRHLTPEEGY